MLDPCTPLQTRRFRSGPPLHHRPNRRFPAFLVLGALGLWACADATTDPVSVEEDAPPTAHDPDLALLPFMEPDCETGIGASGGLVEACKPSIWNGAVVVWGHGYVSPFLPVALPDDDVDGTPVRDIITGLGFGWATTSYRENGLVADVAVGDLDEALAFFETHYGPAGAAYLIGGSEGGLATALSLERPVSAHPYAAGMVLCAPVGNFRKQIEYFGDFRILVDAYFPGLVPGDPWAAGGNVLIPPGLIATWDLWAEARMTAAAVTYPTRFAELLRVAGVATDPARPESMVESALAVLWYNIFATNDIVDRLGGNPYGNYRRWYRGASNPFWLNRTVQRIRADAAALAGLSAFETDGSLTVPVVGMHTTLDPIVPFWQATRYRVETLLAGIGWRYNLLPVFAYGHCEFTAPQVLGGFALMILKATGANLVASAGLFRDAGEVDQFLTTAQDLGAEPTVLEAEYRTEEPDRASKRSANRQEVRRN